MKVNERKGIEKAGLNIYAIEENGYGKRKQLTGQLVYITWKKISDFLLRTVNFRTLIFSFRTKISDTLLKYC